MASLKINRRLIMTPGPVAVDPRVSQAMSNSILGQFDPDFTDIMNDTMELIRASFKTANIHILANDTQPYWYFRKT